MAEKKTTHQFLISGTLHIPEDNWHDACNNPSLHAGEMLILHDDGVDVIGDLVGCNDCDSWWWTSHRTGVTRALNPGHKGPPPKGE